MTPEENLAKRLIAKRRLAPAIDIESLLKEYADVEFVEFPIKIDGLCLGLKAPGRRPVVLISSQLIRSRRRFTMAHELGHVLIPWHMGNIIDLVDIERNAGDEFSNMESEANRFASELLMPSDLVVQKLTSYADIALLIRTVQSEFEVSFTASCLKILSLLGHGYVVAVTSLNRVIWSGRSIGTLASQLRVGFDLDYEDPFPFEKKYWASISGSSGVHVWKFEHQEAQTLDTTSTWREILGIICLDILSSNDDIKSFKSSVSGVAAYANGSSKERTIGAIISAMLQRYHANAVNNDLYNDFVRHPLFSTYCRARAEDFLRKAR